MSKVYIESLESRQHLSITTLLPAMNLPAPAYGPPAPVVRAATAAAKKITPAAIAAGTATSPFEYNLSSDQVSQILAQAASQARPGQAIAVVDREGKILGVFAMTGATQDTIDKAIARARTGAFFESRQEAFTTRTARFIIQDHFPFPIKNTPGGPLYGVEFSSLPGTDILSPDQVPAVSGDPGGLPLFIAKVPAGGIGVAGDGSDIAPRFDLASDGQKVFNGHEEADFDESVAIAGAAGARAPKDVRINAYPSKSIQATNILIPGAGLRFPFVASKTARKNPFQTLAQLVAADAGVISTPIVASQPNPFPKVDASVYGVAGELKNTTVPGFGIIDSDDPEAVKLTAADVNTIIRQAVKTALDVRAAIRLPIGTPAVVHITVVDRDGTLLGAFRENDGTNFSFDVAVQKARTAAFFSDDTHAFSTRAIGFMSQLLFPAGIDAGGTLGPLFHLQNALSLTPGNLGTGPLANGITIFPGGVPLYKDGVMVGAIGISGDGVDQDDEIAYGGAAHFQPPTNIRSDALSAHSISNFITARVTAMQNLYNLTSTDPNIGPRARFPDFASQAKSVLDQDYDFRLPYVKFARNSRI